MYEKSKIKVLIDPGHGPGNRNKGPNGYYEHEGMWSLSVHLRDILCSYDGITASLTRRRDEDPALDVRGGMTRGYDLFISQHSNASSNDAARGVECFYSSNQPNNAYIAAVLALEVSKLMGNPNRGAKIKLGANGRDYFGVIRSAAAAGCPHVFLMENGFHDNPLDEAFLLDDNNLRAIALKQAYVIFDVLLAGQPKKGRKPSPWAMAAWDWAVLNKITDGTNPQGMPTREQVVQLIYNYHKQHSF